MRAITTYSGYALTEDAHEVLALLHLQLEIRFAGVQSPLPVLVDRARRAVHGIDDSLELSDIRIGDPMEVLAEEVFEGWDLLLELHHGFEERHDETDGAAFPERRPACMRSASCYTREGGETRTSRPLLHLRSRWARF